MKKNDILDIKITDVSIDGKGVGRYENMVIFVPGSAVGDYLKVRILKTEKKCSFAKIESIIVPSPDRIDVDCPVYSKCGGCVFRHISYKAELKIKQRHVEECIRRIAGLKDVNIEPVIGARDTVRYRNKMQLPVQKDKSGNVIMGFYRLHSHEVVPISDCILNPKIFSSIAGTIKQWMIYYNIEPYDEAKHKGIVRHIYIRQAKETKEILVCLVINCKNLPYKDILVRILKEKYNNIVSIIININTERTNVILGDKNKVLYGKDYITDVLCDNKLKISSKAFYQVNHAQTEILYNKVQQVLNLQGNETIIDLYSGIGSIGLSMARRVFSVIGVEIVKDAVKDAIYNAKINDLNNVRFICADSSEGFGKIKDNGRNADVIILDPPRRGCDRDFIADISRMSCKKIVYVSCNASTLARDIKEFKEFGFLPGLVIPIDMFPRTGHVETVCLLSKPHTDQRYRGGASDDGWAWFDGCEEQSHL